MAAFWATSFLKSYIRKQKDGKWLEVIDRGQREKSETKSYKKGKNHGEKKQGLEVTHIHILGTGVTKFEPPLPTLVFICPPILLPWRHSKGKRLFWFRVTAIQP